MARLFDSIEKHWHCTPTELYAIGVGPELSAQWANTLQLLLRASDTAAASTPWAYKSLAVKAAEQACSDEIDWPQPNDRRIDLARHVAERIGWHLRDLLNFFPEGLRFFVKVENVFREGTSNDPDWRYVSELAQRGDFRGLSNLAIPEWAQALYIEHNNERLWQAFWCDLPDRHTDDYRFAWRARRQAVDWYSTSGSPNSATVANNAQYPIELRAAIDAFNAVHGDPAGVAKRSPKAALSAWLKANKRQLSANARERIATVANWQPTGGAPKTPGE